jgi:hypothetical protein
MRLRLRILIVVVVCLAVLLPGLSAVAQMLETPQEHIQRLVKEAIGAQPIRQARMVSERKFDDAFRGQFRAMIQQNHDFSEASAKMDRNKIKQLMTAESFVDPAVADADLQELHKYVGLEQENGEKMDKLIAGLRHTLETVDWTAPQRKQIISSFEVLVEQPQGDRRHYLSAEKQWAEAIDDAYKYVGEHRKDIKMQDGSLKVFDDKVLDELNSRIRAVNACRDEMITAMQAYKTMQQKRLETLGINRGDVGLP